jgi:hypothetical protein
MAISRAKAELRLIDWRSIDRRGWNCGAAQFDAIGQSEMGGVEIVESVMRTEDKRIGKLWIFNEY